MSTPFNPNTLDFTGDIVKSSSEAVFVSAFAIPDVNQFLSIVGGIKTKKQIAILGRLNSLLGLGSGECNPSGRTVTSALSGKEWNPATVSDRLTYCWTEIAETFFIWATKNGLEKNDLTGTDFALFVEQLLTPEIKETWLRLAYFGDTDAANYDDSPAGVITNGTNLAFFNKIDGIWKQIYAIVGADASRKTAGLATKNGQSTYALQAFNDTDTTNKVVTKTLQNMRFGADSRLRNKQGLIYTTTQSVADQYERELIEYNVAYTTERLEEGIMVLRSGGITVLSFEFWDRIIESFYNNGTKLFLPHRAILSVAENIQVGTEEESNLSEFDMFYDKNTKTTNVDFQFNLDAKVIIDHEIQVAY
jgi:hypothetical protein